MNRRQRERTLIIESVTRVEARADRRGVVARISSPADGLTVDFEASGCRDPLWAAALLGALRPEFFDAVCGIGPISLDRLLRVHVGPESGFRCARAVARPADGFKQACNRRRASARVQ